MAASQRSKSLYLYFEWAKSAQDLDLAFELAHDAFLGGEPAIGYEILDWLVELGETRAAVQLGRLVAGDGDHRRAVRLFKLATESGHHEAWVDLGNSIVELPGEEDVAEAAYRRGIEFTDSDKGRFNLALLLIDQGRTDEVVGLLSGLAEEGDIEAISLLVNVLLDADDKDDAASHIETLLLVSDPEQLEDIGQALWSADHLEEAERFFVRALESGRMSSANSLGLLLIETGRHDDAISLYRDQLKGGNTTVRLNLADALAPGLHSDGVASLYLDAIDEGEIEAFNNYGLYLWERGETGHALEMLTSGANRGDATAARNLALLLHEFGRVEEAVSAMQAAVESGEVEGLLELAKWSSELGFNEQSGNYLERAVRLKIPGALNAKALSDWDRIPAEDLENLLSEGMDEGDSWAAFNLGTMLHDLGRDDESMAAYETAIQLGSTEAMVNLANLKIASGDLDSARQLLEGALELGDPLAADVLLEIEDLP